MIEQELDRLLRAAKSNGTLKQKLLLTRETEDPVEDFCALARQEGYAVNAGEHFALGLRSSAAKVRGVHGG